MPMTVRVGVVGTGVMGADHVRTLTGGVAGARVVAVSDADQGRGRAVAAEAGDEVVFHADPVDLIGDAGVDAVVVASPDHTHEALATACVEAGKPVLCEKPLAATAADCLRIVAHEVAKGRRLVQAGYMRRFDPSYVDMKRALDAGSIGDPVLVHCVHRNARALHFFTPEMPFTSAAVHEFDVVRWLLSSEIVRVTVHRTRSSSRAAARLADPRLLVLETAAGVTVDVEVFVNAQYGYDVRCELVGELGTVSLALPSTTVVRAGGAEGVAVHADFRTRFAEAYRLQLQAWVDAAARGEACGPSAWDGYAATAVAEACLRAQEDGTPVEVELADKPALYGT
ncbi:myo-inositol 2-dehydrogenase [Saccharopolyspora erythraea NRRL 2338]|nr:inositol 2-dehydrogenase [Saccharopolyspora erythraea D]PFG95988.1 myo-inositol 2-dehydrogenase [Saccharopolyspora erythraea NRRL 2338]CAM02258.1 myo-inositol 2-dehydrogenase [Saccharopolyspora erythraea NRRL 2338]